MSLNGFFGRIADNIKGYDPNARRDFVVHSPALGHANAQPREFYELLVAKVDEAVRREFPCMKCADLGVKTIFPEGKNKGQSIDYATLRLTLDESYYKIGDAPKRLLSLFTDVDDPEGFQRQCALDQLNLHESDVHGHVDLQAIVYKAVQNTLDAAFKGRIFQSQVEVCKSCTIVLEAPSEYVREGRTGVSRPYDNTTSYQEYAERISALAGAFGVHSNRTIGGLTSENNQS